MPVLLIASNLASVIPPTQVITRRVQASLVGSFLEKNGAGLVSSSQALSNAPNMQGCSFDRSTGYGIATQTSESRV
jgi:hypothetical protein